MLRAMLLAATLLALSPDGAPADVSGASAAGESVDAALAPAHPETTMPRRRAAAWVAAERFELPPTRRPDTAGGVHEVEGSFQPAGYIEAIPDDIQLDPVWQTTDEGGLGYAIELVSEGAEALRVQMHGRFGLDGLQLFVYDPVSGAAFGPSDFPLLDENGNFWTTIIFGEAIGLEFYLPPGGMLPPVVPQLVAVNYVYDPPPSTPRGCPQRDVTCEPDFALEAQAVTMLATIRFCCGVSGFCSGALLNRGPGDFSPLIMTANHCVGDQATASATAFIWFFQTATCDGAPPNPNNLPRSTGALLLKRHDNTDWNLLGSIQPVGANVFLGWDSGDWSDGPATGIHHPGGTFKRISLGDKTGDSNRTFCDQNGMNCFDADVWEIDYTLGSTQPGSSGSPVMDDARRVRGTLSGGPSTDCILSLYGRLREAYVNLRYFLGEAHIPSPTHVDGAAPGDPGNHGDSERGTSDQPFNSIYEASFCVRAGDELLIAPGSYNEQFTLWRPMVLTRWGTSGTATIGE